MHYTESEAFFQYINLYSHSICNHVVITIRKHRADNTVTDMSNKSYYILCILLYINQKNYIEKWFVDGHFLFSLFYAS